MLCPCPHPNFAFPSGAACGTCRSWNACLASKRHSGTGWGQGRGFEWDLGASDKPQAWRNLSDVGCWGWGGSWGVASEHTRGRSEKGGTSGEGDGWVPSSPPPRPWTQRPIKASGALVWRGFDKSRGQVSSSAAKGQHFGGPAPSCFWRFGFSSLTQLRRENAFVLPPVSRSGSWVPAALPPSQWLCAGAQLRRPRSLREPACVIAASRVCRQTRQLPLTFPARQPGLAAQSPPRPPVT